MSERSRVPPFSTARACEYARRIVDIENFFAPDDPEAAMRRIERQYGIGFWPLSHLRKGNAKTCDIGLYGRLAGAYLDLCDRLVSRLQEEMKIEAAIGDDSLGDIEIEAGILAAKIAQKKAALVGRKG